MPVLTYNYNNLFGKVVSHIRAEFNLPFYESASQNGGSGVTGLGNPLSGTTTLISCGVDSPTKQVKLLRSLYDDLGGEVGTFNEQQMYGGTGSQGATTSEEVTQNSSQVGKFVTINDVVNFLASVY